MPQSWQKCVPWDTRSKPSLKQWKWRKSADSVPENLPEPLKGDAAAVPENVRHGAQIQTERQAREVSPIGDKIETESQAREVAKAPPSVYRRRLHFFRSPLVRISRLRESISAGVGK